MAIRALYVDIGGVLLTNGWDSSSRKKAASQFGFDFEAMNARHSLMFGAHELGKISLDTYLEYTVFNEKREFTKEQFVQFMKAQSQPHQEMLDLIRLLKKKHSLKIGIISNEGRELTEHRLKWIDFADFYCVSCFVQMKKPDPAIYHLALDLGQIPAHEVIYIDDRELLVKMAISLGFQGLHHTSYATTKAMLNF